MDKKKKPYDIKELAKKKPATPVVVGAVRG